MCRFPSLSLFSFLAQARVMDERRGKNQIPTMYDALLACSDALKWAVRGPLCRNASN